MAARGTFIFSGRELLAASRRVADFPVIRKLANMRVGLLQPPASADARKRVAQRLMSHPPFDNCAVRFLALLSLRSTASAAGSSREGSTLNSTPTAMSGS
jgi:hypothetical protein